MYMFNMYTSIRHVHGNGCMYNQPVCFDGFLKFTRSQPSARAGLPSRLARESESHAHTLTVSPVYQSSRVARSTRGAWGRDGVGEAAERPSPPPCSGWRTGGIGCGCGGWGALCPRACTLNFDRKRLSVQRANFPRRMRSERLNETVSFEGDRREQSRVHISCSIARGSSVRLQQLVQTTI